jgi:hypothetical protein
MNGAVFALAISGSDVYIVGHFTFAGHVRTNNIAYCDGNNWSALDRGVFSSELIRSVEAILVSGNDVYIGGDFTWAGIVRANNIVK